ncbi:MAG: AAA family ATPase [Cyclobacteriaceae bacterium]
MKIKRINYTNFRAKDNLDLVLGERLTLLIGENGSGKTSILDALAIGIGAVLTHLPHVSGISFKENDIKQAKNRKSPFARVKMETFDGIQWDRTERRDKSKATLSQIPPALGLTQLKFFLDASVIDPFNREEDFLLPVFSYYGVSRALLDVPLRRRGFPGNHTRFEALENTLDANSRFKSFFIWFYNKENEEQRKQKERKDFDYQLPELEAVRKAIVAVFPGISDPHIMINPLRFVVRQGDEILDIMQLSDGYKTLLSLVMDLSIRMALANPKAQEPLAVPAVVLIDEIDLHLHPDWQRRVIGDLLVTFPNTQFILTSHSPYIVEAVNNHIQRFLIKDFQIRDQQIKKMAPLNPKMSKAYFVKKNTEVSLLDPEINLIDDQLIHPFNELSRVYDRMRDIQWENRIHD